MTRQNQERRFSVTRGSIRLRRTDTRRNHARILEAADATLAETGEVSFNAVAKRAAVGVGTVYRHFPTPESLVLAVYEFEVQQLVGVVPTLLEEHPPQDAFRIWVADHLAHYTATKRGLADALRAAASGREMHNLAFEDMTDAVAALIQANIEAETVRSDLEPRIVLRGLSALLLIDPNGDRDAQVTGLLDLLWRGMRAER